jgi:hypothetical protein
MISNEYLKDNVFLNPKPIPIYFANEEVKLMFFEKFKIDSSISNISLSFSDKLTDKKEITEYHILTNQSNVILNFSNLCLFSLFKLEEVLGITKFVLKMENIMLYPTIIKEKTFLISNLAIYKNFYIGENDLVLRVGKKAYFKESEKLSQEILSKYYQFLKTISSIDLRSISISAKITSITISLSFDVNLSLENQSLKKYIIIDYPSKNIEINIEKLFNINSVSLFPTIYLQSKKVDLFQNNKENNHFIKTLQVPNPFKGIMYEFNVCRFYYNKSIASDISFYTISVYPHGEIHFTFSISEDCDLEFDKVKDIILNYLNSEYLSILNLIKLKHCVYAINSYFNECLTNISFKILMFDGFMYLGKEFSKNKFLIYKNNLSQIFGEDLKIDFHTQSSVRFIVPTINKIANFFPVFVSKEAENENTFFTIKSHIRINKTYNGVGEFILSKFKSINEFVIHCFFMNFEFRHEKMKEKTVNSIEKIIKQAKTVNKHNLKFLLLADQLLFGPRTINGKIRSYSGLVQRKEQRPFIISEKNYKLLKNKTKSIIKLTNQTYPSQTLCLLCPFELFPYINFHYIPGQLCIPRCTSRPSNKSQYNFCLSQLGQINISRSAFGENSNENLNIINYSPIIKPGRKVFLPFELSNLIKNMLLIRLDLKLLEISTFIRDKYKLDTLILIRSSKSKSYKIYENIPSQDSALAIYEEDYTSTFILIPQIDRGTKLKPVIINSLPIYKFLLKNTKNFEFNRSLNHIYEMFPNFNKLINTNNVIGVINEETNMISYLIIYDTVFNIHPPVIMNISHTIDHKKFSILLLDMIYSRNIGELKFPSIKLFKNKFDTVYLTMKSEPLICAVKFNNSIQFVKLCPPNKVKVRNVFFIDRRAHFLSNMNDSCNNDMSFVGYLTFLYYNTSNTEKDKDKFRELVKANFSSDERSDYNSQLIDVNEGFKTDLITLFNNLIKQDLTLYCNNKGFKASSHELEENLSLNRGFEVIYKKPITFTN